MLGSRWAPVLVLALLILSVYVSGCAMLYRAPSYAVGPERPAGLYRGVYHVHSSYGHDSQATLEDIVRTGTKADLDFVVIADHNQLAGASAYRQEDFVVDAPLLVFGNEVSAPAGHIVAIGPEEVPVRDKSDQEMVEWIQAHNGYAMLSHPLSHKNEWKNWEITNFDGMEIYNFGHQFYPANKMKLAFQVLGLPPGLFLKSFHRTPETALAKWDELLLERPVAGVGAADAHLHVKWLGMAPESLMLFFQSVTMYVYSEDLERDGIFHGLGKGRSFMAFEIFGDASAFRFDAFSANKTVGPGEFLKNAGVVDFAVQVPRKADIRLIKAGEIVARAEGHALSFQADEPGAYRVEVYAGKKIWIISNPIYVK